MSAPVCDFCFVPLFCLNFHPIHIVMDIHSLQEVLLYYKQTEYHPSGLHCMTCVSLCIIKHPGMIIFIICCLPLIGCSVLIGPPQFVDWPFCINLMISARHNNLIVPARKFIFIYLNLHILIFLFGL